MKAAAVQINPIAGVENKDKNLDLTLRSINEAADSGANLIVLPELCNTGYGFDSREEAYAHAESVPSGPSTQAWCDIARARNLYIVAGILESEGVTLYNSAVLVGPDGVVGKYRKTHLWEREKLFFTAASEGFPVFDTKIGRIGMFICYDLWFPEVTRILAVQGADVLCTPTNWVRTPPLYDDAGNCMANTLTIAASHTNSVPIVAADRWGEDRGYTYLGCSLITGTNGWPIGPIGPADRDYISYAELDLMATRSSLIWNQLNDLARDRRTDLYGATLGCETAKPAIR
ncbi:nitrilase family protein [Rhodococcus koreensis]